MYRYFIITISLICLNVVVHSQDIDTYLRKVAGNNPEIVAYGKLLEAKRSEARTGLTPDDPSLAFGYMPGNHDDIGVKKVWSVNQSFSFPTKYIMQNRVSKSTIVLAEEEYKLGKLLVLLEAKLTITDLIYNEKLLKNLENRKIGYDTLKVRWKKMVDFGEATILDYNKISMELTNINLTITRIKSEIKTLNNRLNLLSGNISQIPEFLNYPLYNYINSEKLLEEKTLSHPSFLIPEKEFSLGNEELKLSKTSSMPEFEVGYSSEIVPGETYAGVTAGLTIPLWSNTNRIKSASAKADYASARLNSETLKLKSEVINEFANSEALKTSISEIAELIASAESKKYLDTALTNGEISVTTYFSNLEVIFEVEDKLMELEHELKLSNARLHDHELLKLF